MKNNKFIEFIKDYWVLSLIIIGPILLIIIMWITSPETDIKRVHWHSEISYDLCWDTTQLKDSWQHWKIHWHDDWKAHIEWNIDMLNRSETLWRYMDLANISFSKNMIWKYKNWDKCEWSNKSGKVSVIVNWKENYDFRNYVLNNKDKIKIIFK